MKLSALKVNPRTAIVLGAFSPLTFTPLSFAETSSLNTVVVTANQTQQSLKTVTAKTEVISQQEIEEKQYQTIKDVLQSVPGINLYNSGGPFLGTQIQMRGSTNGQVLVLIDGVSINDPSGFGANFDNIALQDIEKIEIIKSPQAGIWGANAAAGVINIITKSASKNQAGSFTLEKGSFNTTKIATSLSAKSEQADFNLSLSHKSSDGYSAIIEANDDINSGENDRYTQTDISFKSGFNFKQNHRVEFLIKDTSTLSDYDAYGFPSDPDDTVASSNMDSQLRKLQYQYQADNLSAKLYLSRYEMDRINTESFVTGTYKGSIDEKGAIANFEYKPQQTLALGLVKSEIKGKSDYYSVSQAEYQSTGAFISNTNLLNNGNLVLNQSLRSDQFDNDFEDKVTGKLGIKNYFTADVYIGGQLGSAYNTPSLYDYSNSVDGLQPEMFEGYEINLGAYGFEASIYKNEVTDLVGYNNAWLAYNIDGTSTLQGFEVSYGRYFDAIDSYVTLGYEQLSAKNANDEWLGRRPETQAQLDISYDGLTDTVIGLQTRYIGKMYDQNDQAGEQIGEYYLADLTASYQYSKQFRFFARINNLMDEQYIPAVANSDFVSGEPTRVYNSGGRQFFIGLTGQL